MFKKLFIFIFLCLIISGCSDEYWQFHDENSIKIETGIKAKIDSEKFRVDKIEEREVEVYSSPNKTIIDKIISKINLAKSRIYLETYIFTEKRILKSILDAKKRGIDVKVILEKNVLGSGNINKKTFDSLKSAGVDVKYTNSSNYVFTHAKFFLIDSEYIISTGNVSYSTYTINKEFFVFGKNYSDLKILENIFSKDFNGEKLILCDQSLTISPICPRFQIIETLKSAQKEILIFEQSIDDIEIQNLLIQKSKAGLKINILVGDVNKVKNNKSTIELFSKNGISIKSPKKPYVHAKAFLVDEQIIYIGSINFTYNSIENNREIGLIFKNEAVSKYFKNEFERLFTNTQ